MLEPWPALQGLGLEGGLLWRWDAPTCSRLLMVEGKKKTVRGWDAGERWSWLQGRDLGATGSLSVPTAVMLSVRTWLPGPGGRRPLESPQVWD